MNAGSRPAIIVLVFILTLNGQVWLQEWDRGRRPVAFPQSNPQPNFLDPSRTTSSAANRNINFDPFLPFTNVSIFQSLQMTPRLAGTGDERNYKLPPTRTTNPHNNNNSIKSPIRSSNDVPLISNNPPAFNGIGTNRRIGNGFNSRYTQNNQQLNSISNLSSVRAATGNLNSNNNTIAVLPPVNIDNVVSWARPPRISQGESYISEDRLAIVIAFESAVEIQKGLISEPNYELCQFMLTQDTLELLDGFQPVTCIWVTKIEFVVHVSQPVEKENIAVIFRKGSLTADGAVYGRHNEREVRTDVRRLVRQADWWSYQPMLAISGPSEIPICGIFGLSGHYSSPRGSDGVQFQWSVDRQDGGHIHRKLAAEVKLAQRSNLVLDSEWFTAAVPYVFQLTATLPGATQPIIAKHQLIRFDYLAPIVAVYPNTILPVSPISADKEIVLKTEITLPDCVRPSQKINHFWSVSDPTLVHFNESLKNSRRYVIPPYTVPVGVDVVFSINAFLGHRFNQTIGAAYSINLPLNTNPKALINGGVSTVTLGRRSGLLELLADFHETSAAASQREGLRFPMDEGDGRLLYRWSCINSNTSEPCRTQAGRRSVNLIAKHNQNQPKLFIESTDLERNGDLWFSLQVVDGNNSDRYSSVAVTRVQVAQGDDAPQVYLGPILIQGTERATIQNQQATYIVPGHTALNIRGYIFANKPIKMVEWSSPNFIYPLYWTENKKDGDEEIHTELVLPPRQVLPFGVYIFRLKACVGPDDEERPLLTNSALEVETVEGDCSEASISFAIPQGVTQCQVHVADYISYEMTIGSIENCNIPLGSAPLTHQLFFIAHSLEEPLAITSSQLSSVFIFPGPPPPTTNEEYVQFAGRVCDRYMNCQMYYSGRVRILAAENETASIEELIRLSQRYQKAGDPIAAMSVFNSIISSRAMANPPGASWEKVSPDSDGDVYQPPVSDLDQLDRISNGTLDYVLYALQRPSVSLSPGQVSIAYTLLGSIMRSTNDPFLKRSTLAAIHAVTDKAIAHQAAPEIRTLNRIYTTIMSSYRNLTTLETSTYDSASNNTIEEAIEDPELMRTVRRTFSKLLRSAASQISIGQRVEFGRTPSSYVEPGGEDGNRNHFAHPMPLTIMMHDTHMSDMSVQTRAGSGKGDEEDLALDVRVSFGDELRGNFSPPWSCGEDSKCSSVVWSVTIFPLGGPYPRLPLSHRITPVVDITVYSPNTGEIQQVKGLLKAATISVTLTGNSSAGGKDMITSCYYFNEKDGYWQKDGVYTLGIAHGAASCWTGHLTAFVVLRVVEGISADYVIGVVVAVSMGVLVFGIMTIFFVQKKNEDSRRLEESNGGLSINANGNSYPHVARNQVRPHNGIVPPQNPALLSVPGAKVNPLIAGPMMGGHMIMPDTSQINPPHLSVISGGGCSSRTLPPLVRTTASTASSMITHNRSVSEIDSEDPLSASLTHQRLI